MARGRVKTVAGLLLVVVFTSLLFNSRAKEWFYETVLKNPSPENGFGRSVAISPSGETLVVGSPLEDTDDGTDAGSLSVYTRLGGDWVFVIKLSPAPANSGLGYSVAVTDTHIVATARNSVDNSVVLYPFFYDGSAWVLQDVIATGIVGQSYIGETMCASEGLLLVGIPSYLLTGTVLAYRLDDIVWIPSTTLSESPTHLYGISLSMNTDLIVVGSYSDGSESSINAFVYNRASTTVDIISRLLTPPADVSQTFSFGYSVAAITGQCVAVGNPGQSKVHIYTFNSGWEQLTVISDPSVPGFGTSLSFSAPNLLVGGGGKTTSYLFSESTPTGEKTQLIVPTMEKNSGFGGVVLASSDSGIVSDFARACDQSGACVEKSQSVHFFKSGDIESSLVTAFTETKEAKSKNVGYRVVERLGYIIISAPTCIDASKSCDGGRLYIFSVDANQKVNLLERMRNPFYNRDIKFGHNLEISDSYLMVSAPDSHYVTHPIGIVVFYTISTGSRGRGSTYLSKDSIIRYRRTSKDFDLGASISNVNDITVIGMPEYDESSGTTNSGCVHIFKKKQDTGKWGRRVGITSPDPKADELFGHSVSMQSETRFAVSNNPATSSEAAQAVYIYTYSDQSWTHMQTIPGTDKAGFGWKVLYSPGNKLFVSSVADASVSLGAGSITVFELNSEEQYTEAKTIRPAVSIPGERFGHSFWIEASETSIAVGARPCDEGEACNIKGAAYVLTLNGDGDWVQEFRYAYGLADGSDGYGHDVVIRGHNLVVTAPFDNPASTSGTVRFIQRPVV